MADPVDLGERLEAVIAGLVASGRYSSRDKALRASVILLDERERKLAALDAALARGLADYEAGRVSPAADVFDRLEAKYFAMTDKQIA